MTSPSLEVAYEVLDHRAERHDPEVGQADDESRTPKRVSDRRTAAYPCEGAGRGLAHGLLWRPPMNRRWHDRHHGEQPPPHITTSIVGTIGVGRTGRRGRAVLLLTADVEGIDNLAETVAGPSFVWELRAVVDQHRWRPRTPG